MINRQTFYTKVKASLFGGSLSSAQLDSIESILNECETQGVDDKRQIAYIYATAYHEAYNPRHPETRLTPMIEFGGEKYLKSKEYYPYYGMGFSQLTWLANYQKEGNRLGLDLINHPNLILDTNIAANSHVYCMVHGSYTGKKISDYITGEKCDFKGARRIVNGTDQAELIARYAQFFLAAML